MARSAGSTKFKPGTSGNPRGRPAGSGWAAKAREELQKEWPAIRAVLLDKAKAGDMTAIRIIAERICPPLRPADAPAELKLPKGTLTQKAEAVLAGMADGTVQITHAAQLLGAMSSLAKVQEVDEVVRRLEALEKAQAEKA